MGKRKKRRTLSPPESSEEEQYFVEVITAARKIEGKWQYLVKWYGFGDHENSWEPTENFDCERLLKSFWKEVGEHKKERVREGVEIFPREQWIEDEKKLFSETREVEEKVARVSGDSDEDDIPLRSLVGRSSKVTTSSDDEEPLSASLQRPATFKETGLLQPMKATRTVSNKIPKRATGTDVSSGKNKSLPVISRAPANKPQQGPSKPPGNSPTIKSPAQVLGSPVHSQTHSLPSRGPGKTQLISTSIKSSSGLSTKARIATDMAKGLASFGQPKPRYQGLTMRKNTNQPGESRSPVMPSTANPQPPVEPPRQTSLPRSSDEHSNQANQTQTRDISSPQCSLPPPPPRPQPKEPSHDPEPDRMDEDQLDPIPPRPETLTAAEDLLHTIIPERNFEQMPKVLESPTARTKIKSSELARRDIKWSGTLFNSVSEVDGEKLCEVTIQDHTAARGMKLDLFLQKSDSIRLKKFHDLTDLDLILPSFSSIAQLASLVPFEEKDKGAFATLQEYLLLKEKFAYCTLSFVNEIQVEKDAAAYMFIAPMSKPAFDFLCPSGYAENKNALLVALALLTVPTKKCQEEIATFKLGEKGKTRLPTLPDPAVPLSSYHLARHILKVPEDLDIFLSKIPRQCVIWFQESKTPDVWISEDTKYLQLVLHHHRAHVFDPKLKHSVAPRIVFVHVGRMKDMHTMPRIARLRGAPLDLQFLTYGTHPTIPVREWGIHGFNKSGGILTFTANVLLHDLDGVDRLIERVANHEHWACYVTPAVLGAAVQWAKELEYPALGAVISDRLGKRIAEGKIACMIAPPSNSHLGRYAKDCNTWVEFHNLQPQLDPQEIVDDCEDIYRDAYRDVAKRERDGLVLSDLQRDLMKMSNQPAIRYDFRRFVIIKSTGDVHGRPGEVEWCEWKLVSEFKFGDEAET